MLMLFAQVLFLAAFGFCCGALLGLPARRRQ